MSRVLGLLCLGASAEPSTNCECRGVESLEPGGKRCGVVGVEAGGDETEKQEEGSNKMRECAQISNFQVRRIRAIFFARV